MANKYPKELAQTTSVRALHAIETDDGTLSEHILLTDLYKFPDGTMINGKISVTVATNDITVALKTKAGTDPSATDPVFVMINGSLRACTAALSKTLLDGTAWFGLDTRFATLEQDFFAYLIWNTTPVTDIVDIGFARNPNFTTYLAATHGTTTADNYLATGNASAPTDGDDMAVIGRFAATLSATASFNWSVPTFTSTNLIQRPIYETRRLTWVPSMTGYSAVPATNVYQYQIVGRNLTLFPRETADGTSNGTGLTFSAPFVAATVTNALYVGTGSGFDNGAALTTTVRLALPSASTTVTATPNMNGASTWTAANGKSIRAANLTYPII